MQEREPFIFGKGWVHSREVMYFYGATRAMGEADEFESVVLRWERGKWGLWQIGTRLCSVVTTAYTGPRTVICTGIDGYVEVSDGKSRHVEAIDRSKDGPNRLNHVTSVRPIGEQVFAVGMSRMVYARHAQGSWHRMDDGVRIPRESLEIDGLKAIEGDGRGTLVAVGLRGGIWVWETGPWRSVVSPTNIKLEALRWLNGALYIAGGGGLLLRGQPDVLEIVHQTATEDAFWSMESYRGELYLATRRGSLWKLVGDDLERVELPGSPDVTTGWLHSNDDVLLSVGERDLFVYDGKDWTRVPPPADAVWPFEW